MVHACSRKPHAHTEAVLSAAMAAAVATTAGVQEGCASAFRACAAAVSASPTAVLHAVSIACRAAATYRVAGRTAYFLGWGLALPWKNGCTNTL